MTAPTISLLPPAPLRGQAPAVFSAAAEAFVAAQSTLRTELLDVIAWMDVYVREQVSDALNLAPLSAEALALVGAYTAKHQGAHGAAPTLRNSGAALQTGDLYFSTATGESYVWSGSAWALFTPSGRIRIITLGEDQTTDYLASAGQSIQLVKTSAPLRVLFPSTSVAGDIIRISNQTGLETHIINGNGAPIAGSLIDIQFSFPNAAVTFENTGANGWRPI